jgi:hypothetical protein
MSVTGPPVSAPAVNPRPRRTGAHRRSVRLLVACGFLLAVAMCAAGFALRHDFGAATTCFTSARSGLLTCA